MAGHWREAAQHWSDLGCPYESARAQAESGDEEALRDAFVVFDRLGARPAAAAAAAQLRALGSQGVPRGLRRSTRANPGHLTQREVEVVEKIAEGLTNIEIAAQLYLSPKTVERHITTILAKLDAGTRHEAALKARERGMIAQSGG
jgi:DNA-binding CsgD family transcriptional regulator